MKVVREQRAGDTSRWIIDADGREGPEIEVVIKALEAYMIEMPRRLDADGSYFRRRTSLEITLKL